MNYDTKDINGDSISCGDSNRRIRKYSSRDLNVFKYSFRIADCVVRQLKNLGILRNKIKRRGCKAGKSKKKKELLKAEQDVGRIECLISKRQIVGEFSRKVNKNNLICVERQVTRYNYPKIIFANCRSVMNKIDEIQAVMCCKDPDVAVYVETWLNNDNLNALGVDGYRAFHKVRNREDKSHGGGVSILFKENITILSVEYPDKREIEALTVLFRTGHMQRIVPFIALVAVYSPPLNLYSDITMEHIISEIDRIKTINVEAEIMVIGDFNDLEIDFKLKEPLFTQLIKQQTCKQNLVDKCFYNGRVKYNVITTAPISTSDHDLVEMIPINYVKNTENVIQYQTRPKRNSCYRVMGSALANTDWDEIVNMNDLDGATEAFHSHIVSCYENSFPIVNVKKKKNSKMWYNFQIENAIKSRNKYYEKSDLIQYKRMNCKVKELIVSAKKKEFDRICSKIDNKSFSFYKMIRNYYTSNDNEQKIIFPGFREDNSVDLVVDFYNKLLNQHTPIDHQYDYPDLPAVEIASISEAYVYSQLMKIKASSSAAPDGVPNFILGEYALELTSPITILLNRSLMMGYCPIIWKINYLVTIPKKKVVESPSDLRPIVLSSSLVKILERYISNELLMVIGNKIDTKQFGGLPGRAAEHYLTFYLDYVNENLDKLGNKVTAIITDYNKAFDAVDHNLFMMKLRKMDPPISLCRWISSFLCERTLSVKWNNAFTHRIIACSNGAPQGSVLGGLIFSITINEIAMEWNNRLKYVDDLTVLCTQSDRDDSRLPQQIIDSLYHDSMLTKMSLNSSKCQYMVHCFSKNPSAIELKIGQELLSQVNQCKIIGVVIQSDLKWDTHIASIISKATKKLYLLYKLKNVGMNDKLLTKVYCTYIRPSLEYCCVVWTHSISKSQIKELESVQRRVVRIILGSRYVNYESSLLFLDIDSLECRRMSLFRKYAYKFLLAYPETKPATRLMHSGRNTRAASQYCVNKCRTQRYKRSPLIKMIEIINSEM